MNVNEIYNDITSFWDSIYPIIVFHVVFYGLYLFIFGAMKIKSRLENYTKSEGFERTKKLMEQFELWKKLPYILAILILVYFALFNSATNLISSIRVFPLDFSYSYTDFMDEYGFKPDMTDILKYSSHARDASIEINGSYGMVDQLMLKYLDEFKIKYPDRYESWVDWNARAYGKELIYFRLSACLVVLLIVTYVWRIQQPDMNFVRATLKFVVVLIFCTAAVFVLRYRTEQKMEQQFVSELMFVRNELKTDQTLKPVWTDDEIARVLQHWKELKEGTDKSHYTDVYWFSRTVEKNWLLTALLGPRKIDKKPFYGPARPVDPIEID